MIRISKCGLVVLLLLPRVLLQKISVGYVGEKTTIDCPIEGNYIYPTWRGPPVENGKETNYYDPGNSQFNPVLQNRYAWANNSRSLILTGTRITDNGAVYTCLVRFFSLLSAMNTLNVRTRPSEPKMTTTSLVDSDGWRATEGQTLDVTCISQGGFPAPTVALYLGSITGLKLAEESSGIPTGNTFTVTLKHTFAPTRPNDRQHLVCRSYYPTPADAQDSQQTQAKLFLYLKPENHSLVQLADVTIGSEVAVKCTSTGSRPAATIEWLNLDQPFTPAVNITLDNSTQTFTTVSVLRLSVTPADNGKMVQCRVTNQFFTASWTETGTLDVKFAVSRSSTTITGNELFTATGSNPLNLTCITGSSNPASSIVWSKDNVVINNSRSYSESSGQYKGIVRSQVLTLYPRRSDDGGLITCLVFSAVMQVSDKASVKLNLRYRPIVTIQTDPELTIVEQSAVKPEELPCNVNSKPLSNVTWRHNGNVLKQAAGVSFLPFSISSPNRTSYGSYTCSADNGVAPSDNRTIMVKVQFRPLGITIRKPESITADGRNNMSISCETDTSYPVAEVTWSTDNIQTSVPINIISPGQYGGTVVTSTVTFTPTRDHDGAVVSCSARNTVFINQKVSNSTTIDNIKYSPLVSMDSDKIVTEGERVVLKCSASSKPDARFRWTKGVDTVAGGSGTAGYNGLDYTIANVSRTHNGTYTCFADNQILPNGSNQTNLVVHYPPDVVVIALNATVYNRSTTVTCDADGVPESYMYEGWLHTWDGHNLSHQEPLPTVRVLNLTGLSYAHSGVYKCGVSNGVKKIVSYGEGSLLIKSFPILIDKILAESKEVKANGLLMKPAIVKFQYYSNAGNGSVSVRKSNNTGENVGEIHQGRVAVNLPVFQSEITTIGTEVTINITVADESQFGKYEINVTNEIDTVTLSLVILPLGPPETPVNVNITLLDHHSVNITWLSGFHNGLNQTFVIQISTDNSTWWNTTLYGGMSVHQTYTHIIDNLTGSQMYFWRMLAVNGAGESQPTATFSFQTSAKPNSVSRNIGLIAGGAAGGTVAALVVFTVIFIVWRRKHVSSSGEENNKRALVMTSCINHNNGFDDGDEEVNNWLYEPAGPPQAVKAVHASTSKHPPSTGTGDVYAKVNKKAEVVYAMPNKHKGKQEENIMKQNQNDKGGKQTKGKTDKTNSGDIYENAPTPKNGNISTSKSGDSAYEATSITKPTGKDGLLYAELEFGPKKKGPTKIIGIEDRCEYSTIDLTKKAQPLPDSDDDEKTKK